MPKAWADWHGARKPTQPFALRLSMQVPMAEAGVCCLWPRRRRHHRKLTGTGARSPYIELKASLEFASSPSARSIMA